MIDSDHPRGSRRGHDPGFARKRGAAKLAKYRHHNANPSVGLPVMLKSRLAEILKQHDIIRIAYDGRHATAVADLHERRGGKPIAKRIAPIAVDGPSMALCPAFQVGSLLPSAQGNGHAGDNGERAARKDKCVIDECGHSERRIYERLDRGQ